MAALGDFKMLHIVACVLLLSPASSAVRRACGPGAPYGENCGFVPAPPGKTPACAQPGYTYCEQLDHYPNDLIRHLVDRGEYDLSSLLSDETRDEFGATRPQGPYGYGPHSLPGTQAISIVTERPLSPKNQFQPPGQFNTQDGFPGSFQNSAQFHRSQQFFGQNKGNLPPPPGYIGYYTPSFQQRPPYSPPQSFLSQSPNSSTSFPVPYWRGNSYFELPPRFRSQMEYYDSNGPGASYRGTAFPPHEAWGAARGRARLAGQALTTHSQQNWWQRPRSIDERHSSSPYTPVLSNELKQRSFAKRDTSATSYNKKETAQNQATNMESNMETAQQINEKGIANKEDKITTKDNNASRKKKTTSSTKDVKPKLSKKEVETLFWKGNEAQFSEPANLESIFSKGDDHTLVSRKKRQASTTPAEQLCPTRSQYIMPRAALNKEGNWMYVVNMGQAMDTMYSQLVKSEVCISQQCNGLCSLPLGYSSRCEQKYVQKRLVALEQNGQRLYTDVFWFPSCCLCTISNNQT